MILKTKLLVFSIISTIFIALGLVVMGVSIILSCFQTLYGHPPDLFNFSQTINVLKWLLEPTQFPHWFSFPLHGWSIVTAFTPIVIILILYLLYRKLIK